MRTLGNTPSQVKDSVAFTPSPLEQDHNCVMPSVSEASKVKLGTLCQASRGVLSRSVRNSSTQAFFRYNAIAPQP